MIESFKIITSEARIFSAWTHLQA